MTEHTTLRRIAMFVHTLNDRAVARLNLVLCEQLTGMGVDTTLVCGGQNPDLPIRIPDGVAIDDLGIADRHLAFGITRLASMLRARRPDVLFAHLNGPGRAAILARAMSRVPTCIVVVEHTHYSTFGWDHPWLRDRLTALLYPRADRVAGVSPAVVQDLATHFPNIRCSTVVLPAVGPDPDAPEALGREPPDHPWFHGSDRPMIITSVANVVPRKGQDTLVEALSLVRAMVGDVRLVIVGRFDDPHFLARLQQLAANRGVADAIALEVSTTQTPTPLNPLGAKGIGESATIGSTPAVQNAVVDALSHLGVRQVDIPCPPEPGWRAGAQPRGPPAVAAAGECSSMVE